MTPMTEDEQRQIVEYLPLIKAIAKHERRKYRHALVSVGDFTQEGILGALSAIRGYESSRGPLTRRVRFLARQAIADHIREFVDHLSRAHRKKGGPSLASLDMFHSTHDTYGMFELLQENPFEPRYEPPLQTGHTFESLTKGVSQRDRQLLHMHYIQEIPQVEIARRMDLSDTWVSQKIAGALKHIRSRYSADNFN